MLISGCTPENNNLPTITVSRDTIIFDTVFTNMGSMTKIFLIRNNSNETVNLDRVYIPSGDSGPYRFNVNGYPGPSVTDLELEAHDSMYVFVEVTLNPNGGNNPLIVEDSIVVEYNNSANYARAMLVAFGQDAIYYYPTDTTSYGLPYSTLPCDITWGPGKPIVVVGYLQDTCGTLTVLPGTQVHFYSNGALFISDGATLDVQGEAHNPVVFQGSKLEYEYRNTPGQWDRIYLFEGSTQHHIRNAIIKNAFIGLQCDDLTALMSLPNPNTSTPKKLVLENVRIQNMSAVGILSRQFNIDGYNVLIDNCGQYCAAFTFGGNIKFYHSTFANYWSGSIRNFPSLYFNNYFYNGVDVGGASLNFEFDNSIAYGSTLSEVGFDSVTTHAFNYQFNNCLLRLDEELPFPTSHFVSCVKNEDPDFTDDFNGDYTLKATSAAINIGSALTVTARPAQLMFDLKGVNRLSSGNPDAGAFEK